MITAGVQKRDRGFDVTVSTGWELVAVGVDIRALCIPKSVQLFCTAAVPYRVNHHVTVWSCAYGASFGGISTFGSPLIPFDSHSFPGWRPLIPFESLFGFPLGLLLAQHFQHQQVLGRHLQTILICDLGTVITTSIVNRASSVSLTSEDVVEVIVIVIVNLGRREDCWSRAFGCRCRCLQSVITLMNVSDPQLSSGKLFWRHVLG